MNTTYRWRWCDVRRRDKPCVRKLVRANAFNDLMVNCAIEMLAFSNKTCFNSNEQIMRPLFEYFSITRSSYLVMQYLLHAAGRLSCGIPSVRWTLRHWHCLRYHKIGSIYAFLRIIPIRCVRFVVRVRAWF